MAPEEIQPGALSHDIPCVGCGHDHSALPCDWCPCGLAPRNGIYTAPLT